tara:strand:- start:35689 stop:36258 length:570 start_codon:yes stop_codon:yes gene_type:complete
LENIALRKKIKAQRQQLSTTAQQSHSKIICNTFLTLPEFQHALHVAVYFSVKGEVDTSLIIEAIWQQGKKCYLPIINDDGILDFVAYDAQTTLIPNKFGILEPKDKNNLFPTQQLDMVVTPLVAFDEQCNRLGMGMGYYDKTFAFLSSATMPKLIGLAYECQKTATIDIQDWDIPMNQVVTEKTTYTRK